MTKRKKRSMTLLEIMVVIFIIGIVGAVIGVNMKGSLEQGKAFKSEKGSKQIYEILNLELARGNLNPSTLTIDQVIQSLNASGLVQDASKLMQDGWGRPYHIFVTQDGSDVRVVSDAFINHLTSKRGMQRSAIFDQYFWMDARYGKSIQAGIEAPSDAN